MNIKEVLYKILIQGGSYWTILKGLWATVQIATLSLVLGTLLGAVVCALRLSRVRFLRIAATDHGQIEAARTLGFPAWEAFRLVTLPQVIRITKPDLGKAGLIQHDCFR